MTSRALIVDGNSLLMRAIMASALSDLRSGGQFTGGVYGALGMLRGIVANPDLAVGRIVMFFDGGVPPRRLALIPEYKSKRKERRQLIPEDQAKQVFQQIDIGRRLFRMLGVKTLRYKQREADDGVAAAVRCLRDECPVVVTSDRDLWQTILMGADVWDLTASELFGRDDFVVRVGVAPEDYIVFRALVGDASDSIAGAHGCGPKRAAQIIAECADYTALLPSGSPREKLDRIVSFVNTKGRCRAFETAIVEDHDRLASVIEGIDLSDSFGPTDALCARLDEPTEIDMMGFLRECQRLEFRSVLGDPDRWLRPFRAALER